jgi:hypothetical protein
MILLDEYLALPVMAERPPPSLGMQSTALTYSRAHRLIRALVHTGPGRLQLRGRFTRLADALSENDREVLFARIIDPDHALVQIVDPRPLIRAAAAIQNTYALSLLQTETLAAAVTYDWPIRFGDRTSITPEFNRASIELGLDLAVIEP